MHGFRRPSPGEGRPYHRHREDGYVVATDEETGVTSQGEPKAEALANLGEALRLHDRPVLDEDDVDDSSTAPWL